MFTVLMGLLGSRLKACQTILVHAGAKPGARFPVPSSQYAAFKAWCAQQGMVLLEGSSKIPPSEGYQDGIQALPLHHPSPGNPLVFLAKDLTKALAIKAAEELGDQTRLGIQLGYPRCCIESFIRRYPEESKKDLDFLQGMHEASTKEAYPVVMNVWARYQDAGFLYHCPCSLDCGESRRLGEHHRKVLERHAPFAMARMAEEMMGEVEYGGRRYRFGQGKGEDKVG